MLAGTVNVQNSSALGSNNTQLSPNTTTNASVTAPSGTLGGRGATLQLEGGLICGRSASPSTAARWKA